MKKLTISSFASLVLSIAPAAMADEGSPVTVTNGHLDIAAHYDVTTLETELAQHPEPGGGEEITAPLNGSTVRYNFGTNAPVNITVGSNNLGFLWATPEDETVAELAGFPLLGFSAEELSTNSFSGSVIFTMTDFSYTGSGNGNFYLFKDDTIYMNSTLGTNNYGSISVQVNQHEDGQFGFSQFGSYGVTFVASATLTSGSTISSDPQTLTYNVIPEPSTYALVGLGAGMLALLGWRRRSGQS